MSFAIVEFEGPQKDIAVVHRQWIIGNKCYWPPFWRKSTQLQKAVERGLNPDQSTWSLFPIRLVGNRYFATYVEARQNLIKAEIRSDFSSEEGYSKPRRKRAISNRNESSSEEESLLYSTPKSKKKCVTPKALGLPVPPNISFSAAGETRSPCLVSVSYMENQMQKNTPMVQNDEEVATSLQTLESNVVPPETVNQLTSPYQLQDIFSSNSNVQHTVPITVNEFDGRNGCGQPPVLAQSNVQHFTPASNFSPFTPSPDIYSMLLGLQNGQAVLGAKIDLIMSNLRTPANLRAQASVLEATPWLFLPLSSIEKFEELEAVVTSDNTKKETLISTLAARGGNNQNQITYRIMSALMLDELMTEFTFAGHGTKRSFKQTLMLKIICEAVRRDKKGSLADHKEIEKAAEYWLKRASLRLKKIRGKDLEDNSAESQEQQP